MTTSTETQTGVTNGLRVFPVIALELTQTDSLYAAVKSPEQAETILTSILERLGAQLGQLGGTVLYKKDKRLTFCVQEARSLEEALDKSLRITIAIVRKDINLQKLVLRIKAGIDLAQSDEETLIAGVTEREAAETAQIIFSQRLYELCKNKLPFEVIGPLPTTGEPRYFHRLMYHQILARQNGSAPAHTAASGQGKPVQATQTQATNEQEPSPRQAAPAQEAPKATQTQAASTGGHLLVDIETLPALPVQGFPDFPIEAKADTLFTDPVTRGIQKAHNVAYNQASLRLYEILGSWLDYPGQPGRIVALALPPTQGKTTLLSMIRGQLPADQHIWVNGQFFQQNLSPDGTNLAPLGYWVDMAFNLFGLPPEGIPHAMADSHFSSVLQNVFPEGLSESHQRTLRLILGLMPPAANTLSPSYGDNLNNVIDLFETILTYFSRKTPLVLSLEDIDYADESSIQVLTGLLERDILGRNVSIVLTCQPNTEFQGRFGDLLNHYRIEYIVPASPTPEDLKFILETPLTVPSDKLPAVIKNQFLLPMNSPMLVEEGIRFLVNQGGLEFKEKENKFAPVQGKLKNMVLPATLDELLQLRLSQLPDAARLLIQLASLVGHRISHQLLASLYPEPEQFESVMQVLWEQGFLTPESQSVSQFRHHLLWQVAYNSIPASERPSQHAMILQMLEQAQSQVTLHPNLLAYHAAKSEQSMLKQAVFSSRLTPWLMELGLLESLNRQLANDLAVAPAQSELEAQLCEFIGILNTLKNPDIAVSHLYQALHHPVTQRSPEKEIPLSRYLAVAYKHLGSPDKELVIYRRLWHQLRDSSSWNDKRDIASCILTCLHTQGHYREMLYWIENALFADPSCPAKDPVKLVLELPDDVKPLIIDALIARAQPNTSRILEHLRELPLPAETQIRLALRHGLLKQLRGDFQGLEADFEALLEQIEQLENTHQNLIEPLMAEWGYHRALYLIATQQHDALAQVLPVTLTMAQASHNALLESHCLVLDYWSELQRRQGKASAEKRDLALNTASSQQLTHPSLVICRLQAEFEALKNAADAALTHLEQAISLADKPEVDNCVESYRMKLSYAQVLMSQGHFKEAGKVLEATWPLLVQSGYIVFMIDAAEAIARLYELMGTQAPTMQQEKFTQQAQTFQEKAVALRLKLTPPA